MSHASNKIALVIGAAGGIGGETAAALLRHGWSVRGLARRPLSLAPSVVWIKGDAMNAVDVLSAAQGADVIVHAVNPPGYRDWDKLVLPMLDNTIAAAKAVGARIVLPGTIYNFGADAFPVLREDSPQHPESRKGAIRVAMEERLQAAAAAGAPALDPARGRFLRSEDDGELLVLRGHRHARRARQAHRRADAARADPCLGLSSRCRRDDRAAVGSRERFSRFRSVSLSRPSTGAWGNGRRDPPRDGEPAFAHLAFSLAAGRRLAAVRSPVPRNGRDAPSVAQRRLRWTAHKLRAFLGAAMPATPIDERGARRRLVGLGCLTISVRPPLSRLKSLP